MQAKSKAISGLMVSSENGAGALLQYQTEKAHPNVWTNLEELDENFDTLMPNAQTDDFNYIRLRLQGNTNGTPIVFHGTELLSIQDKGLDKN